MLEAHTLQPWSCVMPVTCWSYVYVWAIYDTSLLDVPLRISNFRHIMLFCFVHVPFHPSLCVCAYATWSISVLSHRHEDVLIDQVHVLHDCCHGDQWRLVCLMFRELLPWFMLLSVFADIVLYQVFLQILYYHKFLRHFWLTISFLDFWPRLLLL